MPQDGHHNVARQLWELPTASTSGRSAHCTPFTLPAHGILSLAPDSVVTLTTDVVFQPECTGHAGAGFSFSAGGVHQPFSASTTPQTYVIAATTTIAWVLVVMLIIATRTTVVGNPAASSTLSRGHGIISGATARATNIVGVGSRPWLQKAAALTVAISLTIATADTFKVLQSQYDAGYLDASVLRDQVLGSLEIRVTRVISDVFLWLAQVQTLIRLFPRHKEKVLIKWIGFALIIFDSVFSCLNSFVSNDNTNRPGHFDDAIPALSYLFELALGLLYAAWVMYYALTKRRYAFYHPRMRSICLIALLSLTALLTPVVFFVTDVSNQDVAGWGDYFRWVGAAAASVVVWEWVERIEALERDEKRDGILGREVFDGDEMLEAVSSEDGYLGDGSHRRNWSRRRHANSGSEREQSSRRDDGPGGMIRRPLHLRKPVQQRISDTARRPSASANASVSNGGHSVTFNGLPVPAEQTPHRQLKHPTPPAPVASPVSRADTSSAGSTVYVVRYDTATDSPLPVRRQLTREMVPHTQDASDDAGRSNPSDPGHSRREIAEDVPANDGRRQRSWNHFADALKRKRLSPPAEVQQARRAAETTVNAHPGDLSLTMPHRMMRNRLGALVTETGARLRERYTGNTADDDAPVIVIPAQPRNSGRTWSPDMLTNRSGAPPEPESVGLDSVTLNPGGSADETSHRLDHQSEDAADSRRDEAGRSSLRMSASAIPPHRRSPLHTVTSAESEAGNAFSGDVAE